MFEEHGFAEAGAVGPATERVGALTGAVDALLAVRVDELDEAGLRPSCRASA